MEERVTANEKQLEKGLDGSNDSSPASPAQKPLLLTVSWPWLPAASSASSPSGGTFVQILPTYPPGLGG